MLNCGFIVIFIINFQVLRNLLILSPPQQPFHKLFKYEITLEMNT